MKNNPEEQLFLEQYDSSQYEKMSVAVDLLVFTIEQGELKVVLVRREQHPFQGCLSLPGVFVGAGETLDAAARRGMKEETGVENLYFEQLYTWGEVERDPRMRIISVSYLALIPAEKLPVVAGERTTEAGLFSVDDLLKPFTELAFDHKEMIAYGRERLKNKVEYTGLAFELLPETFTLPQLQEVYEILLGKKLYKANFRKKMMEYIQETDEMDAQTGGRPSRLYHRIGFAKEKSGC